MTRESIDGRRLDVPVGARIDLGCGARKASPAHIGVDTLELPGVDIVDDALSFLQRLPDEHVAEVHSSHFLEHIDDPTELLRETARVLQPEGRCEIVVPHFSNPYYYSDLTHRSTWGLYTLSYLIEETPFRRTVPKYAAPIPLHLTHARLIFRSPPHFPLRTRAKRVIERLVNRSTWWQEFYEENVCWMVPCFEARFTLARRR